MEARLNRRFKHPRDDPDFEIEVRADGEESVNYRSSDTACPRICLRAGGPDRRPNVVKRPREIVSDKTEVVELEPQAAAYAAAGSARIAGYATFYGCQGVNDIASTPGSSPLDLSVSVRP